MMGGAGAIREVPGGDLGPLGARTVGGRGSFLARKSPELLQSLLQLACYRHSSLLGLPEPPRLACLISPDIVMIRCGASYSAKQTH